MINAIVIDKTADSYTAKLTTIPDEQLGEGDVLVNVNFSTINYKDALAITGKAPVIRKFPIVPGIDFVGEVEKSSHEKFSIGDVVLLNGFGVGENHSGGLAQKAKVRGDWLIKLPSSISQFSAMAIGTAGYTAMLCIMALEKHNVTPDKGDILVTGATGGVGSFAVSLLAKLGYSVVASTGDTSQHDYLKSLGVKEIINRDELSGAGKPLMKERWAGVIDSVGSHTLVNACASTNYGGTVAACGLAQGMDFPATVAPFIIRGVTLVGIDSVMRSIPDREAAWQKLSELIDADVIKKISTEISLAQCIDVAQDLLDGKVTGRLVVNVNN